MPPPLLCLDFGGVLTSRGDGSVPDPGGPVPPPDPTGFAAAYWQHRNAYDLGCTELGYWGPVLRAGGLDPTPDAVAAASAADSQAWLGLARASRALLTELATVGTPLALLSNAPHPVAAAIRATDWADAFAALVFSCEIGALKPDPAAYRAVPGSDGPVLFFDDRPVNVDGARAVGWDAHVWTGPDAARPVLRAAGFPV